MDLRRLLVLTGDHGLSDPTKWDGGYSEHDLELHSTMLDALRSLGRFEVGVHTEHATLLDRLRDEPPQLVMNLCDTGFANRAALELNIPALLDLLGIPYTGAPPSAMVLAYDKSLVALLAGEQQVPVAHEAVVRPGEVIDAASVRFPAFIKPASGDGSVGITRGALAPDEAALRAQLAWLEETLPGGSVLVQEYLPGPEYGLALLGNPGSLRALPMLEVDFSALPPDAPPILAFESKTGPATVYDRVGLKPASLPRATVDELVAQATRMFERLGCRDYARFDFRTAADGTIRLMEVNPNPAWSCEAKLARMAGFAELSYSRLLEMIVDAAWVRACPSS